MTEPQAGTLYCNFCGKSQHEVRRLIAGPTAFICDECVTLCATICVADPGSAGLGVWYISRTPPLSVESIADAVATKLQASGETADDQVWP